MRHQPDIHIPPWTAISLHRRCKSGLQVWHYNTTLSCGYGLERSILPPTHSIQYDQHTSTDQPQLVVVSTHQPHLPHSLLWSDCGRYLCGIVVTTWWHPVWPSVGLCGFCGDLCGQHRLPQRSIIMFESNTGRSYACIRWPLWLSHGHQHHIDGATHLHRGGMAVSRLVLLLWPAPPHIHSLLRTIHHPIPLSFRCCVSQYCLIHNPIPPIGVCAFAPDQHRGIHHIPCGWYVC